MIASQHQHETTHDSAFGRNLCKDFRAEDYYEEDLVSPQKSEKDRAQAGVCSKKPAGWEALMELA
jgi:hypothetical protein